MMKRKPQVKLDVILPVKLSAVCRLVQALADGLAKAQSWGVQVEINKMAADVLRESLKTIEERKETIEAEADGMTDEESEMWRFLISQGWKSRWDRKKNDYQWAPPAIDGKRPPERLTLQDAYALELPTKPDV